MRTAITVVRWSNVEQYSDSRFGSYISKLLFRMICSSRSGSYTGLV